MSRVEKIFAIGVLVMSACQTPKEEFAVTTSTVAPRSDITWLGNRTPLVGLGQVQVGQKLPDVMLTNLKMEQAPIGSPGHVKVIDTIPSIDTPVCDRQTHILSETKGLDPTVERVTISLDLPYAQRRFAEEAKIDNLQFLSDYRENRFARASGLQIERNGLLARSVIVVDREGIVRHVQIVPEITQMPDMDKAFEIANQLAGLNSH